MTTARLAALILVTFCYACAEVGEPAAPPPEAQPLIVAPAAPAAPQVPGFYTVALSPELNELQVERTLEAIEIVNAKVGFAAFRPVVATLSAPRDWWITVLNGAEFIDTDVRGWSGGSGLNCEVRLHPQASWWHVVAHELAGHCVDLPHVDDPRNYMVEVRGPESTEFTQDQIDAIVARVQGRR